jgi:hypothetical protein
MSTLPTAVGDAVDDCNNPDSQQRGYYSTLDEAVMSGLSLPIVLAEEGAEVDLQTATNRSHRKRRRDVGTELNRPVATLVVVVVLGRNGMVSYKRRRRQGPTRASWSRHHSSLR